MNTYLGAAQFLHRSDLDADAIAAAAILYLEGYLWDPAGATRRRCARRSRSRARRRPQGRAHAVGRVLHRSLPRRDFRRPDRQGPIDILFANENELRADRTADDFEQRSRQRAAQVPAAGGDAQRKGLRRRGRRTDRGGSRRADRALVDTTGAGDLFAAGFLLGLSRGADHRTSAQLGRIAAAEVIQHLGARPEVRRLSNSRNRAGLLFENVTSIVFLPLSTATHRVRNSVMWCLETVIMLVDYSYARGVSRTWRTLWPQVPILKSKQLPGQFPGWNSLHHRRPWRSHRPALSGVSGWSENRSAG